MNLFCSFVLAVVIFVVGLSAYTGFKIIFGLIRFVLKHSGAQLHDYWDYMSQNAKDIGH